MQIECPYCSKKFIPSDVFCCGISWHNKAAYDDHVEDKHPEDM